MDPPSIEERGTISQPSPARDQQSYRHEALIWHGAEDYTRHLTTFVTDGLEADEPVLLVLVPEHRDWLSDALGDRARAVGFLDMTTVGANPARILPTWQEFLDAHPGRPVRGVGEPIWPGRRPAELVECQLHEALLNVAVDPLIPFWLICPYDADLLEHDVIHEAHRSHPVIVEADDYSGSTQYAGRAHVEAMLQSELPPLRGAPITTNVSAGNAERLEAYLRLEAYVAGLAAPKAGRLAEAAQHLALAALHRGAAEVTIRICSQPDAVVCEIWDPTQVADALTGRRAPLPDEHVGFWAANQLCDLVQWRSSADGTTVRVHAWR